MNDSKDRIRKYLAQPFVVELAKKRAAKVAAMVADLEKPKGTLKERRAAAKRKKWLRKYNARPEVKAKRAAHNARPEVKAKRDEYNARPEVIERRKLMREAKRQAAINARRNG